MIDLARSPVIKFFSLSVLLLWGLSFWVIFWDYSYQGEVLCTWDVCSTQTCYVNEKEPYVEITEHIEYLNGEKLQEIADYLTQMWRDDYAQIIVAADCGWEVKYNTKKTITPDDEVTCEWSVPICGDWIVDSASEECDLWKEYNGVDWSWCDQLCKQIISESCGDGVVQDPEECDLWSLFNWVPWSWCDRYCSHETSCGDGIVQLPETCDLGKELNGVDWTKCSWTCTLIDSNCWNSTVDKDLGEECDVGELNGVAWSWCSYVCKTISSTCWDGLLDLGEKCDDGNRVNGDWCSDLCLIEWWWTTWWTSSNWWTTGWTLTWWSTDAWTTWWTVWWSSWHWWFSSTGGSTTGNWTTGGSTWWSSSGWGWFWSVSSCGNYVIETGLGEECDLWPEKNGAIWEVCSDECKLLPWSGTSVWFHQDDQDDILEIVWVDWSTASSRWPEERVHNAPPTLHFSDEAASENPSMWIHMPMYLWPTGWFRIE